MTIPCEVVHDSGADPATLAFEAVPRIGDKIALPGVEEQLTVFDVVHRPADEADPQAPRVVLHASVRPAGMA